MNKKINIMATIKDGIAIAGLNFLSLILVTLLYVITIWIPYLNVGTTIAMASLPAELAKGNMINPLFIFESKYRRNMGEFFILMALMTGAISVGFMFMGIPGIVISIAWNYAVVLFVDKDMSALDSLRESNRITYGNKWRIFGAEFLICFALCIVVAIIAALFGIGNISWLEAIGTIINAILIIFIVPAIYGVDASIYRQLTSGEILEGKAIKEELKDIKNEVVEAVKPEAPKAEEPKAEEAPKAKAPRAKKAKEE